MKQFLFYLVSILMLNACNNADKKQVETLQKETMDIHDAAMKDMAEMNRIAREIKEFLVVASMTPEQSAIYMKGLTNIGEAENEMMAWMRDYQEPKDKPAAEAIQYLKEQKAKIQANHEHIKTALEEAKKLLPLQ